MPARSRTLALVVAVLALVVGLAPAAFAGSGVERAQRKLNQLGCDAGRADGSVDPHTRSAVIRFQAANRMRQNGRLTKATRSRLHAATQVRCDRRPVVRSGTGRRVVISQHQNYVWLVRADGSVQAQGPMVDNTRVLRPGSYTVGSHCGRSARIRQNSDYSYSLWLPFFVRFAPCGVAFHQVPVRKSDGRPIHPDWLLGTNGDESAGCIRLSRRLAAQVWEFAGVGTRIVVR